MTEIKDNLDRLFEKAFADFEESPPEKLKSSVFKKMLFFNTWRTLRKYITVIAILILVGGTAYYSGVFTPGRSGQPASYRTSMTSQIKGNSEDQKENTSNSLVTAADNEPKMADPDLSAENSYPEPNKQGSNDPNSEQLNTNKKSTLPTETISVNTNLKNNKPNPYDKTNTLQVNTSSINQPSATNPESTGSLTLVNTERSSGAKITTSSLLKDKIIMPAMKYENSLITEQVNNILMAPQENQTTGKRYKLPLLWSIGLTLGHSVTQSDIIKTSEQVSDANFNVDSKLTFPSGYIGLNARAEKRHFFFDFGLQYTMLSEKISPNSLLHNAREYQDITYLGQNTIIDTNGAYWHYFYISDSTIRIIDSVWTWRVDTSLVNMYDTAYLQTYDTLKNSSWVNTYSLFEFPLNVGWMKNFGRVNFGVSTGPIISLLVGTKGSMPYHITNNVELIATKQEFQAFRFGLSWQIAGIAGYQFTDRLLLELSPYYRHTLLPFRSSVTSSTLKNNSFGLQLGLRYYF